MDEAAENIFVLIGLCLAPLDDLRTPLLERAAKDIDDWNMVYDLSGTRYVTPLVYVRLKDAGLLKLMPEAVRNRFNRLYLNVAMLGALRLEQVLTVSDLLGKRGGRLLFYKGSTLVIAGDYPDPGQRLSTDIDLLCEMQNQKLLSEAFAEAGGWRAVKTVDEDEWIVATWINTWGTIAEIHWKMRPYNDVPSEVSEHRLWSRAREVEYRGKKALLPSIEDRFIQAAIHGTAHHAFDSSVLYVTIADLAHLASGRSAKLDWDKLGQDLKNERMLEHAAVACELGFELTRYQPLYDGLCRFRSLDPGLEAVTASMTRRLLPLIRKPWVFESQWIRRLFTSRPLRERIRYFREGLKANLFPGPPSQPEPESIDGIKPTAQYRRKITDPDFAKYLLTLYRFYKKINYHMK